MTLLKKLKTVVFLGSPFFLQLNLSTIATLGTEGGGRYREVETRVKVWTVRQTKMAVEERWPSV